MLDDFGLAAAVKWYADQQARRAGLPITVDTGENVPRLPPELEAGCFRVVQEAVTNALRHARATTIRVRLMSLGGELLLEVADDGAGFDPATTTGGFGLTGMRERAELLGGALAVVSAPGRGTTITLRVPAVTTTGAEP
jgi:signal transduction histidine kinase